MISGMKKNPWILATIALAAAVVLLLIFYRSGGGLTGAVTEEQAGESVVKFINSQ